MNKSYSLIVIWASICFTGYQALTPPPAPSSSPLASPCDVAAEAKSIVDSNRAELIVMRIIPFRKLDERKKINDQVRQLGVTALIPDDYMPVVPGALPWQDLCFVLLNDDKNKILSRFMSYFLKGKDETLIIIIMLLVDNMTDFKKAYDDIPHQDSFDHTREDQRKPFQNMLRVWAEANRAPDGPVDQGAAEKDAKDLLDEKPNWDEDRGQLEKVLMKSSYPMAKAILAKYEEKNKHPIEDDINSIIKNKDLQDAYSSLATYIKDKYKCLAKKLHDHATDEDNWATWNIIIAVLKPDEWKQIDASFKKDNDNISIVDFISKNILGDFVLMEVYAYLIDPTYKPKFLGVPPPVTTTSAKPPAATGPPVPPPAVVPPVQPATPAPAPTPAG